MTINATLTATGEPLENFPWTFERGLVSPPIDITLTNDGTTPASPVVLRIEALSPTAPDTWIAYGLPILDEQWIRGAVTGYDASGISGGGAWTVPITGPVGLGSTGGIVIPEWPAGGIIFVSLTARPPGDTFSTGTQRFRVGVLSNENALGVPYGLETGIVSGVGRPGFYGLVSGFQLTYNEAPDPTDELPVAAGLSVLDGAHRWSPAVDLQLDQLDGDDPPVALATGEAYRAIGYVHAPDPLAPYDTLVEVVKGLKSATGSPVPPVPPDGSTLVFDQVVTYDPGGVSVLVAADLVRGPWYGRFAVEPDPANGLALLVHPGEDIGQGVRRIRATPESVTFPPNVDGVTVPAESIWLDDAGALVASSARPSPNARRLVSDVTTDATDVLTWRYRQQFPKGEVLCQELQAPALGASLVGLEVDSQQMPQDIHVAEFLATLRRDGLASAGETRLDVTIDADPELPHDPARSIWPAGGTPLVWPDTATGDALTVRGLVELPEIPEGSRLSLWLLSLANGGQPSSATVCLRAHRTG